MTAPSVDSALLETTLRARRSEGRKLLVPYVTGGLEGWREAIGAAAAAGADAIEVGLPFSDPVMDGPVIQAASQRALAAGATPGRILEELAEVDAGLPLAVMTYYNLVFRAGHDRFSGALRRAGVSAAIVPDLPLEEAGPWCAAADAAGIETVMLAAPIPAADAAGIETVMLAAPTAPDERLPRICARARGFVYAVGLLGVTGERASLAASAMDLARRLKAVTDKPVLIGVGVSDAAQARQASTVADGVIQGASVMRRLMDDGPEAVGAYVAEVRAALDGLE